MFWRSFPPLNSVSVSYTSLCGPLELKKTAWRVHRASSIRRGAYFLATHTGGSSGGGIVLRPGHCYLRGMTFYPEPAFRPVWHGSYKQQNQNFFVNQELSAIIVLGSVKLFVSPSSCSIVVLTAENLRFTRDRKWLCESCTVTIKSYIYSKR